MNGSNSKRRYFSLVLKMITAVCALTGTAICAFASRDTFMGGTTVLMYFTIQSNLAVALISLIGFVRMLRGKENGRVWRIIRLMGAVSITLTGIVFCFVLAPVLGAAAWDLQSILAHVVVPVTAVIDFFCEGIDDTYQKRESLWVIIPPLMYAVYAGIGYVNNWQFGHQTNYPYFFLNWGSPAGAIGFCNELPYMGCVWWILALLLFLIAVGTGYLRLLKKLQKASLKK